MTKRIIMDADTGIDDTLALAYLLAQPKVELLGVVGVYGNVHARVAHTNNRMVLEAFGRADIPTAMGCTAPSWAQEFAVDEGCARFHGDNGFGGVSPVDYVSGLPKSSSNVAAQSRDVNTVGLPNSLGNSAIGSVGGTRTELRDMPADAVRATCGRGVHMIIDAVRQYGEEVTVLATGPLTDVDAAIRIAPDIAQHLQLVMMGGALTQQGNCYDLICETNIIQDPEAADRVFHSGAHITMIGLDVTHQCLLTRRDIAAWEDTGVPVGRFLADMTKFYISANESSDEIFAAGSPLHDPLAAAVAVDASLVGCFDINMMVETQTGDGFGFRGRTIGDRTMLVGHSCRTHVALSVDAQRFHDDFVDSVTRLCQEQTQ
ncbi:nucleoside hydrolase [Bifidobacterium tsurumiense]|uniref:Inosine-uridine nucleoside N-ribohydrolase n=1 Tax=Bifidobacterium tsurumiense TaxID=356829 RepID=A0A087EFH1_9BIFI|nr:nucleoside hydrolase [Bifidobacterium tsurumiense]KFJ06522.1 Inosine-uridine nucleoside N-ribohydrolase [Bifidobacterium tsurumiense]